MPTHDHELNINGTTSQYNLIRDDNGKALYSVTEDAPELVSRLRFEQTDWIGGHGQYIMGGKDKYYEGQSIDTTQPGKVFLAPLINEVYNIASIDVGSEATDRSGSMVPAYTLIDKANPANADGIITSLDIWANTAMTGVRVGTFYFVSGTDYKCRASTIIGSVTQGSKQTFSGLSIAVKVGDFIGYYCATGNLEASGTGGTEVMGIVGEYIDAGDQATYSSTGDQAFSLYAIADFSELDSTPTCFAWAESAGKWLCATAGKIYYLGTSWVAASTTVAGVKEVKEFNGLLYAACGSGTRYYTSPDANLWTQTVLTDADGTATADGFLVAADPTGITENIWKYKTPNKVAYTANGGSGGVNWSTDTFVGDTANNITNMLLNADKIYVWKEDGLYWLDSDGGVHAALPDELKVNHSTDNGKYVANWQTSSYFSLQRGMGEMTTVETFRPMGPLTEIDDIGKVGVIVGLTSDKEWVYVAIDEGTNTHIYKGREVWTGSQLRWEWCPFVFLGTNACTTIRTAQHSPTDKRLWFGYGTHTGYVILSDNPLADSAARFCSSGWLRTSYTYGADPMHDKLWQSAVLEMTRVNSGTETLASSGETVQIKYRDDTDIGVGTACISAHNTSGVHEVYFDNALANKRIQFELWLASGTSTATPVVTFFQAKGVEKPTTVRIHEAYYSIGDKPTERTKTIRTLLRAARDSTTLIKFADLRYGQTVEGTASSDYVWCVMMPGYPREVEVKREKQRAPELGIMVRLQEVNFRIS